MQKLKTIVLCCLLVGSIVFSACETDTSHSFTALVIGQTNTALLVEPVDPSADNIPEEQISISMGETTEIYATGQKVDITQCTPGTQVRIYFSGQIAESYPPQIFGAKIEVLSQ